MTRTWSRPINPVCTVKVVGAGQEFTKWICEFYKKIKKKKKKEMNEWNCNISNVQNTSIILHTVHHW